MRRLSAKQDLTNENKIIYTKNKSYVTADLTEFARNLLDDTDAATARQTLNALGKNENAVSATQLETAWLQILTATLTLRHVKFKIEISGLTADDVVNVVISPNNQGLCVDCGLCPSCEIFNGILRFRAKVTPTADISAEFYILKGASNGKEKSFGSVNCSTSQRVIIYKVPSQVGSLSFNGKIQTPTWDDYDPTKLLMIGEISGVNADIYTVSFIPIGNCTWSSDTREPRTPTLNNFDAEKLTLSGDFENLVV